MRILPSEVSTITGGANVPLAVLVEMDLNTPLYLNSSGQDLTIGGVEYRGVGGIGQVSAVQDTPGDIKQLSFSISGVPSASISQALGEPVQGKAVRVKLAIFDPETFQIKDARVRWAGRLDTMSLEDNGSTALIAVSAEHAGIDLIRPSTSTYSDLEQRRLHPGDLAFQFVNDQAEMRVVWPAASFGRR